MSKMTRNDRANHVRQTFIFKIIHRGELCIIVEGGTISKEPSYSDMFPLSSFSSSFCFPFPNFVFSELSAEKNILSVARRGQFLEKLVSLVT